MHKILRTVLVCLCAFKATAQNAFTSGNLIVFQTSGTASKASSAATLKEFTPSGVAAMSVSLPVSGPTPFQTAGIYGGSEGFLSTSSDGKYLVVAGYATAATFSDITGTTAASVTRAIGQVYPSGFYLQRYTSNTFYSANDIRGGVSDGSNFWASGASANNIDGINFFGPGTQAALGTHSSSPAKAYGLRIFNGQIYYSTQKAGPVNTSSQMGIFSLGGLPTSGTPIISQVINTGATATPEDFSFNPAGDICYIAINLNNSTGGIQKWTKSGSIWSLAYTLGTGVSNIGAYGIVVDYSGTNSIIYATTFESTGNRIIKIIDAGSGSAATTIVPATANVFYKGITFAPVASGTPVVNISVDKDTASEAGMTIVTVTANASAPVSGSQSVTLGVAGIGITAADYLLSATTLTIPNGFTSASATFTITDDILPEGTETASLSLSAPTSGLTLGIRTTQNITITDNDANTPPSIALNVASTSDFLDGGVVATPASPIKISGVINDPTDPAKTLGLNFSISDVQTPASSLTVNAKSSNTAVVPVSNINLTGTGSSRNITITPAAVGYANITVTVNDGLDSSSYIINYAASSSSATPANTTWHTGISDGSDAIVQNDSYYMVADDELNVINVYSRNLSGLPLVSYNYTSNLSLPDPSKPEVDIEASTPSPIISNRSYWLGSMSNGKAPFDNKPNRDRIFATTYTGTGAATTFTFFGYTSLKSAILAWGDANGYNFTASAAAGVDSKLPSGYAAEGMVFGPDNTTLYIGLRAPLVPIGSRTKAVIVPIQNFEAWFNNGSPTGAATFGAPIELNLGSRGIRDIIRLSNGEYIIIAGDCGAAARGAIYKWTGYGTDAPILVNSVVAPTLNIEGVAQVNTSGLLSLTNLEVITDMGDDILYNDGSAAKDFGDLIYRKFRSDILTSIDLSYPEIDLQGNAISIINGDITPSTTDNTDFGNVLAGTTTSKTFVIRNTGFSNLSISGISFTGINASDFMVTAAPSFPWNIAPNNSQSFTVQFLPMAGTRTATLNITSNDYDEAAYSVAIKGNGTCSTPPITGTAAVCIGSSITLANTATGTWASASASVATIGSSGVVSSVGLGTSVITFTQPTGCSATKQITVNPLPGMIIGFPYVCEGSSVNVGSSPGGTWSTSGLGVAVIGSTSGIVSGITSGTEMLTYTLPTGCYTTRIQTVHPLPAPITGSTAICVNDITTLSSSLAGTWSSAAPAIADINSTTGIVTALTAGTTNITCTLPTGCSSSAAFTVNALPATISGPATVCQSSTVTLINTGGGTWSSSATNASVGSATGITYGILIGTETITYTLPTGCASYKTVSVLAAPAATTGPAAVCMGQSITLTNAGGLWSSGTPAVAVVGTTSGIVNGITAGSSSITYTLPDGCFTTTIITVNPLPVAISGSVTACEGAAATLSNTGGGTWSSADPAIADAGSLSGIVTGIASGTTVISYTLPTGCSVSASFKVNTTPANIIGTGSICAGATATLTNSTLGGIWLSSASATATVGTSGTVTGRAAGTSVISYMLPTGCLRTKTITVNALPVKYSVTGGGIYCAGSTGRHISLSGSQNGISYRPYISSTAVGTAKLGTGTSIDFGSFTTGGIYKVIATNTSTSCTATMLDTAKFTMVQLSSPSVSISTAPSGSVCKGTPVTFIAAGINNGLTPRYIWKVNGHVLDSGSSFSYTPANGDQVKIEMVSSLLCAVPAKVSDVSVINVIDPVIPSIAITRHTGPSSSAGKTDTLFAAVTNGGTTPSYQWVVNSTYISGATSSAYVITSAALIDSITCFVTSGGMCGGNTSGATVTINRSSLSLDNQYAAGISVLPNPNIGYFTVKGTLNIPDDKASIEITNMLGQVYYNSRVDTHNGILDHAISLSNVASGSYLLTIRSASIVKTIPLIIEK